MTLLTLWQDFNPSQSQRPFFAVCLRSCEQWHIQVPACWDPEGGDGVQLWEQENIDKFISIWVYSAPPRNTCLGTILAAVLVVFCTNHIYNSYYQPKSWIKKHLFQFYLCKVVRFSLAKQQRNVSYQKEVLNIKESKTNPQPSRTNAITDIKSCLKCWLGFKIVPL